MNDYLRLRSALALLLHPISFTLLAVALPAVPAAAAAPAGAANVADRAATGRGLVMGFVSNDVTGQFLEGASVAVEGTSLSTRTERGGGFSLSAPAGPQTLVVSFTGMTTARVSIVVAPGETVNRTIALTSDIYRLEPYSVTGRREGNALAIEMQRQADNVKTVVSTDAFGSPAVNPGELLARLPGVSVELQSGEVRNILIRGFTSDYTSLMVDGNALASSEGSVNSRIMNISQIATNNLESVELIKAPTPDMSANAIGGYVNVRTKRAFDRAPGRRSTVSIGTRWTEFENKDIRGKDRPELDTFTASFSDVYSVFGARNNLGVSFTFGYRNSPLLLDEAGTFSGLTITNHFLLPTATNGLTSPVQRQFGTGTLSWPDTRNLNVGLNVDFKLSNQTYVYLKNTYNDVNNTSNDSAINRFQVASTATTAAGFAPGSNYLVSEVLPAATSVARLTTNFQRKTLQSIAVSAGVEHRMLASDSKLELDLSYSLARSGYPVISQITAYLPGVGFRIDRRGGTDEFHPLFTQTGGPSIYDPANYTVTIPGQRNFRQTYKIPNEVRAVRADYRKNFPSLGVPAYLKGGFKLSEDVRKYQNTPEYFTYFGPAGIRSFVAPLHKSGDDLYGPFPHLQGLFSGQSGDAFAANPALWGKSPRDLYDTTYYVNGGAINTKLTERVSAGYIMGSVQLPKLRIVPGLRVERTDTRARGRKTNSSRDVAFDATRSAEDNAARAIRSVLPVETNTSSYVKVHPGLHLIYEPLDRLLVRASYNNSITRPPVLNLVPSSNTVNNDTQTITVSNPNLRPYTSDNFELAVQKYFEPVGSFEVGVYLKEIKDYFRNTATFVPDGPDNGFDGQYVGYTLNRSVNLGSARYRGFEFNYQQQFNFLPGFWRGFGFSANYTYTQAQGAFGGTTYLKQLANIRPRFGNIALSYVAHGLDARLLYNYQGGYYRGGAGATTLWGTSQTMLDFKTAYRINRRYVLYLDISNLLDENVSTYVQEGGLPLYSQKQGTLFASGITMNF